MSNENVELVREIYALWSRGDSASHLIDPKLEYVNPSYAVESGVQHSRRTLGKVREVYPDFRVEPERFLDAGTSASGLRAQWRQGYVWTVREGTAIRFRWFNQPAEALEAVGLTDQDVAAQGDGPVAGEGDGR
jgi:ketosteroid isomerase-like protein